MNLKNSARFIKAIDYVCCYFIYKHIHFLSDYKQNITIIHDYDTSKCYIIPFALQRREKPSNIYKNILNALVKEKFF